MSCTVNCCTQLRKITPNIGGIFDTIFIPFIEQGASTAAVDASAHSTSLTGAMANTLGELVDSIAALSRMEASITAFRAELIDQARQWSEVTPS